MDMMEIYRRSEKLGLDIVAEAYNVLIFTMNCEEDFSGHILERFEITQPTLSHHMHVLCDCHLVRDRKEGRWHYYALNEDYICCLASFFQELVQREKRAGQISCDEC